MNSSLALLITYNPDAAFFNSLPLFLAEFSQVLIVDNASQENIRRELGEWQTEKLQLIINEENLGVATALNQGFAWALERGFEQVFTFDQDSYPAKEMVEKLQHAIKTDADIAVVAAVIKDLHVQKEARFLRARNKWIFEWVFCKTKTLDNISFAITAGSLYSLKAYQQIGPFREDFFIDYIDQEYGLRANKLGYEITAVCSAFINHRLGEREKRELAGHAHYPTFHSPLRWYYISRNRIPMLRKYALRFPHWFSFEIISSVYIFFRMLLFEDLRRKKLLAIFLGTRDGILGLMGRASEKIERTLA
jgi:rhamnosyltransferase